MEISGTYPVKHYHDARGPHRHRWEFRFESSRPEAHTVLNHAFRKYSSNEHRGVYNVSSDLLSDIVRPMERAIAGFLGHEVRLEATEYDV